MPSERCDECGFDSARWTDQDAMTTAGALGPLWEGYTQGLDAELAGRRPAPGIWSIGEYTDHARQVVWGMRFLLDTALDAPGTDLGASPDAVFRDAAAVVDLPAATRALTAEGRALSHSLADLPQASWSSAVVLDGRAVDVGWIARHAVHDVTHRLRDVARIRRLLGDAVAPDAGRVAHLHVSRGGVPKLPHDVVDVGAGGLAGDRQANRRHHGRPFQAVSLWGAEVIEALQRDGHPIAPGRAGENLTLAGTDWPALRPGTILAVGESLVIEVSSYATPCKKNAQWFADGDFTRILHDRNPGWSRLYAWVIEPGRVCVGDAVLVEP